MIKYLFFFLLGIYIQFLVFTGRIAFYVNTRYSWLILLAGIVITFVYWFLLVKYVQKLYKKGDFKQAFAFAWKDSIYVILAVVLFIITPAPLGTSLADNRNFNVLAGEDNLFSQPSELVVNTENLALEEWISINTFSSNLEKYQDKPAEIEGMVFNRNGELILGKFSVSCCAVDASILGLNLVVNDLEVIEGNWYRVTGTVNIREEDTIELIANSLTEIEVPDEPYFNR